MSRDIDSYPLKALEWRSKRASRGRVLPQSPADRGKYLDSWKEIAAYLNRNIRTCWLWEHELGLPVHRLDGSPKARVFAYTGELDAWRAEKIHLAYDAKPRTRAADEMKGPSSPKTIPIRRSVRTWIAAALVAGPVLAAVATGLIVRHPYRVPTPTVIRSTIKVEPGRWLAGWTMELQRPSRTALAISSDGSFIVYSAIKENPGPKAIPRLYVRRMDRSESAPIAGTEGGMGPFLRPDGKWVGFWTSLKEGTVPFPPSSSESVLWTGYKLMKVPVEGGVPSTLYEAAGWLFGAAWGPDNSIVFTEGEASGLSRISAEGGKPENLTTPDPKREEYSHRLPCWLPDGKAVLYTVMKNGWDPKPALALLILDGRESRVLVNDAADGRYIPTGHIVFLRRGRLLGVRFDPASREVVGQPFPLVDDVMQAISNSSDYSTNAGQFSISNTGTLVYAPGGVIPRQENSLVWLDQKGSEQPVTDKTFPFSSPRLSPDGRRIAVHTVLEGQIWVYDLSTGTTALLTNEGRAAFPIWSPDGRRLLFSLNNYLFMNLFWQASDGSSSMERLTTSPCNQWSGSWSADGKTIAFVEWPGSNADIVVMDVASRRVTPFLNTSFNEMYPDFSPDGRWLAYTSDESKQEEVYVRPFPGPGPRHPVSTEGGIMPLWSKDGKRIFYRRRDQVWAVDVRQDGGFSTGKPRLLFERPGYGFGDPVRTYDLSHDGQRFLMYKYDQRKPTPVMEIMLVENWFEEVRRLAPAAEK
jgi:hypothetical protein